ncbi:hypothetical protein HYPSUDRAFT_38965 [Hypholoma sublateritium FD-334 SS-4]|uniref:Uncharacterized protein n=1 Tax=Hypholoma sublateritium (strain FD-334 SS-4) TaxID=945553 RepID=A0A0D2MKH9_HYPSF|nr:hypothetical protein HYPSUDRAFT_38965 [Hypholoma sublateritium FD-334 SS-4]
MRFQFLLSATLLAGVLPALALPLQYADVTALEARTDAPLAARSYLDDSAATLERRQGGSGRAPGTGSRSRHTGPPPVVEPHNSHEAARAAFYATEHRPAAHDTFHTGTGHVYTGEHVHNAIHEYHHHDPTPGGHASGSAGKGHPKPFRNDPNRSTGERPFPEAVGHGPIREYPLVAGGKAYHQGKTGSDRIMMQQHSQGAGHSFLGVTGHGKPGPDMEDHHVAAHHQYQYSDRY